MDLGGLPRFPNWLMKLMFWMMIIGTLAVTFAGFALAFWSFSHVHWK